MEKEMEMERKNEEKENSEMDEFERLEEITELAGFSDSPLNEIVQVVKEMARYVDNPPQTKRTRKEYLKSIQEMISMYWNYCDCPACRL